MIVRLLTEYLPGPNTGFGHTVCFEARNIPLFFYKKNETPVSELTHRTSENTSLQGEMGLYLIDGCSMFNQMEIRFNHSSRECVLIGTFKNSANQRIRQLIDFKQATRKEQSTHGSTLSSLYGGIISSVLNTDLRKSGVLKSGVL